MRKALAILVCALLLGACLLPLGSLAADNPTIGTVVVTHTSSINVRALPDAKSEKLHYVSPRAELPAYSLTNGWYLIMTPEYVMGYVSAKLVRFEPSTANLPLPQTLPREEAPVPGFMANMRSNPDITVPQYLPAYQKATAVGGYAVYSGPGAHYYRQNQGKAHAGTTQVRVFGAEGPKGEWVLIGYGLSDGGYRMGYIDYKHATGIRFPVQFIANMPVRLPRDTILTDDPIVHEPPTLLLPAGTVVTVLAYLHGSGKEYAMVELQDYQGQPLRGFILRSDIPFDTP